ncbi:uncharacterized protein LOC131469529 isoform X2 [Solea solea]|uniref:uncharacterized protein LOC131469529 isoform X2 n=1 Tax=Solea solea TaxID=90069 RepID=UPI00272B8668|nr:uncharacterized protein LOC131469529 isoform X2 [Solea solea]XP_058500538.1 uncharacterized protein LOC131469529 isoform X2 [Solea solea]XP_058500539.1 uncharacterized protein LOC131469529 isoform X2 [Solea solea]XP_058500540.1 uncharacterized protein LOC131469529 isoform X2 [Solea solea]XP_058500541.1 uncharacterized protein LOC131469529 isoform X2 [Solea solea]
MEEDLQDPPLDQDFQQCSSAVTPQEQEQDQSSECPPSDLDRDGVLDADRIDEVQMAVLGGHKEETQQSNLFTGLPQDQDLTTAAANEDEARASCDSVPALVVTQAEVVGQKGMMGSKVSDASVKPPPSPEPPERPGEPARVSTDPSLSCSGDGRDMICADLLSLRSDSVSLASETTVSRRSEEDDTRSLTTSSVTSLFHRLQLDPLEKAWWRSSALGNMAAQRQLLAQEPSLVVKKDFLTTALHWAAKQGRQEVADMMLRSGADVNVRSVSDETRNTKITL